jgi:hypothetical protein
MTQLVRSQPFHVDEEQKQAFAALVLLKKLDLKPADGGMELPVVLPAELSPLDEVLQQMAVDDLVRIDAKRGRWELTKPGLAYLAEHIDEAAAMVDELDDLEVEDELDELLERNLDVLRARFLWGWYDGEFDDLVVIQRRRGVNPVEPLWAFYLTSDAFYAELAKDLEVD